MNHVRRKRSTSPIATSDILINIGNEHQQLAEYQMRLTAKQVYPLEPESHAMNILKLCKDIMQKAIPRYVFPSKLLDDAYNHFLYLYYENDKNELSEQVYTDITYALGQCLDQTRLFKFNLSADCPPVVSYLKIIFKHCI